MRNNDNQQKILRFINEQIAKKGYPPTIREICAAVGLRSPSTVHAYLNKLAEEGLIEKDISKGRAIRIPKNISSIEREYLEVPVLGKVSAGLPILAQENIERTFPLPMDFARKNNVFMLRIQGESMINVGIFDGDYIIVEQQPTAQNGNIIVALIDDEVTVKRFYKENGYFRLQPENDFMEPIITDHVVILGKVVGVFRML